MTQMNEPAKLLLLITLLAKDRIISNNNKAFLKELILRRDARLSPLVAKFETSGAGENASFLDDLHELVAAETLALFDELFADTSLEVGKALSKGEREQKQLSEEKSLIYGEVEFASFYRVLRKINADPGLIFYDLGSGTGKAVMAARMTQDFSKCIGIEILQSLHNQAEKIVTRFNESFKDHLTLGQSQYTQVFCGSFTDYDWSDGDVVFANSTCFGDELMLSLSQQAESLKPGSFVVTFTKGLTSTAFELLERKRYRMSWGPATVFIHRRLNLDGTPVGPARLNLLPSDNVTYDDEIPFTPSAQRNGGDDEEDDDSGEYDVDIDYDIKQFSGEEDEEDDEDNEEDDDNDEDEDEEEEEEGDQDDDSGNEDDDDEDGGSDDNDDDGDQEDDENGDDEEEEKSVHYEAIYKSDSFSPTLKMRNEFKTSSEYTAVSASSPKVAPSKTTTPSSTGLFTHSSSKSTPSPADNKKWSTPTSTPVSSSHNPLSLSPALSQTIKPPSLFSPPPSSAAISDFAQLHSPQDTALLMRRRVHKPAVSKVEEIDSDDGEKAEK